MGVEGASQVDDHYSPKGKLKKVPVSLWKLGEASYPQANLPWGLQECWGTSRTGPHLWEAVFLWAPMTYQGAAGDWGSISKLTRWSIHRTLSTWPHYKGRTVFFFLIIFFRGAGETWVSYNSQELAPFFHCAGPWMEPSLSSKKAELFTSEPTYYGLVVSVDCKHTTREKVIANTALRNPQSAHLLRGEGSLLPPKHFFSSISTALHLIFWIFFIY